MEIISAEDEVFEVVWFKNNTYQIRPKSGVRGVITQEDLTKAMAIIIDHHNGGQQVADIIPICEGADHQVTSVFVLKK